jgi:hypothetical protein
MAMRVSGHRREATSDAYVQVVKRRVGGMRSANKGFAHAARQYPEKPAATTSTTLHKEYASNAPTPPDTTVIGQAMEDLWGAEVRAMAAEPPPKNPNTVMQNLNAFRLDARRYMPRARERVPRIRVRMEYSRRWRKWREEVAA